MQNHQGLQFALQVPQALKDLAGNGQRNRDIINVRNLTVDCYSNQSVVCDYENYKIYLERVGEKGEGAYQRKYDERVDTRVHMLLSYTIMGGLLKVIFSIGKWLENNSRNILDTTRNDVRKYLLSLSQIQLELYTISSKRLIVSYDAMFLLDSIDSVITDEGPRSLVPDEVLYFISPFEMSLMYLCRSNFIILVEKNSRRDIQKDQQ